MDFVTYLEALPPISISKLYSSEWTCQAVLRGLPPLAKQYVVRMLWADGPIPQRKPGSKLSGLVGCGFCVLAEGLISLSAPASSYVIMWNV